MPSNHNICTTDSDKDQLELFVGLARCIINSTMLSIADLNLELVSEIENLENNPNRIHDHIEKLKWKYDIIDRALASLHKFKST